MSRPFNIAIERLRSARDRLQEIAIHDRTIIQDPFERLVALQALEKTYALLAKRGVTIPELVDQEAEVRKTISAYTPRQETTHA